MGNWLLYIHCPNGNDKKYGIRALKTMQKNLAKGNLVYVVWFGPTVLSECHLSVYSKDGHSEISRATNKNGIDDAVPNLEKFMKILVSQKVKIDAICIWSHGAGYGCSPWSGWTRPLFQINDAIRIMVVPFNVKLVCFDACYQGGMSCLYELPDSVVACLASPAFHPYYSVISTKAFGKLKRLEDKEDVLRYARKINCEWHKNTKVSWKCLLVFDMDMIRHIGPLVKKHVADLVFDKMSQIDNKDANLHDLFAAARNVPILQTLVVGSFQPSCTKCINSCTLRVRGPSVEAHTPRKWIKAFISTKWYKEVVKGEKGFEEYRAVKR